MWSFILWSHMVAIKLPTRMTVFTSEKAMETTTQTSHLPLHSGSGFNRHCELIDPNALTSGMRSRRNWIILKGFLFQKKCWAALCTLHSCTVSKRLTTNRGRPVPPAFPTKIPELASNVSGWELLVKATLWYSSQSM